jgi:hypothetical protein
VQRLGADAFQLGFQPRPKSRISARKLEVVHDGSDVQCGAADDDGHHVPAAAVGDRVPGEPLKVGDG